MEDKGAEDPFEKWLGPTKAMGLMKWRMDNDANEFYDPTIPPDGPIEQNPRVRWNLPMAHIGVNLYRKDLDLYELKCILRYKLDDPNSSIESIESLRLEIDTLETRLDAIMPDRATKLDDPYGTGNFFKVDDLFGGYPKYEKKI